MHKKHRVFLPSPKSHPLRDKLKKLEVTTWQISQLCGVSRGYMSQMLCGTATMPRDIEQKLLDLLRKLTNEQANQPERSGS